MEWADLPGEEVDASSTPFTLLHLVGDLVLEPMLTAVESADFLRAAADHDPTARAFPFADLSQDYLQATNTLMRGGSRIDRNWTLLSSILHQSDGIHPDF